MLAQDEEGEEGSRGNCEENDSGDGQILPGRHDLANRGMDAQSVDGAAVDRGKMICLDSAAKGKKQSAVIVLADGLDKLLSAFALAVDAVDVRSGGDAGLEATGIVDRGSGVGDLCPLEAPFLTDKRGAKSIIGRGPRAADTVVGLHEGMRLPLPDAAFEGTERGLAHGLLVEEGGDAHTLEFLVVGGKVFDSGIDSFAFHSSDFIVCHIVSKVAVLGNIFEVSSSKWCPVKIGSRAIDHRVAAIETLFSHQLAATGHEVGTPRVGDHLSGVAAGIRPFAEGKPSADAIDAIACLPPA